MEQRNLFLAIALAIIILIGSQLAMEALYPPPPPGSETVQETTPADQAPGRPGDAALPVAPSTGAPGVAQPGQQPPQAFESPRIAIDTPRLSGSIALRGARIDDLVLRDYYVSLADNAKNVVLFSPSGNPNGYYAQFGWIAGGSAVNLPDDQTVWQTDDTVLMPDDPVVLRWNNGEGLEFIRTISVDRNYMFTVEDEVRAEQGTAATLYPYGLVTREGTPATSGFFILHEGPIGVFNETLEEIDYDDLQDGDEGKFTTTGGWLGITDKYWLAALVPQQGESIRTRVWHRLADGRDKYQTDYLEETAVAVSPGSPGKFTSRLFAGAKEVNLLERYQEQLGLPLFDRAVDFGWLWFITKPIFHALDWLNGLVGNFGVAILILTLGIKILFFPLANKSYKAMSRMKLLQPEMMKIRERFTEDKQKMQQEMMALYKREKVNPAAGCIPILIQIPVFFALYKVLFVSIEMRHAPFFGWIEDLSAQDPTNVFELFGLIPWGAPDWLHFGAWPILMGITMFLQQRLNPQPADPVQARIFMFMPLIFTVFLASFPAGLVVYWAWNNTLSIAQQWIIMRRDARAKGKAKKAST